MDVYEDPATWTARPARPQWQLALRFAGSVVWFPVVCVLWAAVAAVLLVVGMFAEVVTALSSTVERGYLNALGWTLERVGRLASWCVSWPELRHEGDVDHYKARVDKAVAKWTARASAPVEPKKPKPPVECAIPLRAYRGVGGWYVAEVALAQGWELRPTDEYREVRLWWSAASRVD
ncbi:hypothetical protein G3I77_06165 [Streptomyces sp. D2-8]|uniref:hypothetical protein n=1 Tax=Streptomyces sp. D2-8 TaxID=2707767 RepID=UPI0020C16110|nr:hypothetical protein [Streptomyces sp. D2-8]MCK8432641.1 hypothetical protein [Streptomyces sp. D2-8]